MYTLVEKTSRSIIISGNINGDNIIILLFNNSGIVNDPIANARTNDKYRKYCPSFRDKFPLFL